MATTTQKYQTMYDLAQELGSDGKTLLPFVEIAAETNAMIGDMPFIPCNSGLFHKGVIRNGLPTGAFRKLYGGVPPEKTEKVPVTDTTCMLEGFSEVDEAIAKRSGNVDLFRMREAQGFFEGLSQTASKALLYGDVDKDPEQFNGLGIRYGAYGTDKTKSSYNVINGAGSNSDNTSIWLINWSETTVTGIFPTGARSKIGIAHDPLPRVAKTLSDNNMMMALQDHFIFEYGIHVSDWRRVVRIANLKTGNFETNNAADLMSLMRKATYRIPGGASNNIKGRIFWYMNADTICELERQMYAKNNVHLTINNADGKPVPTYRGIPIHQVDQISSAEATCPSA